MNLAELKQTLEEKEKMKIQTELVYQQLMGQIALVRDMIKREEAKTETPVTPVS
jgi:hypothetical protein